MKAAVSRSFGPPDVVTVADVPRPEPRDDEIRVEVAVRNPVFPRRQRYVSISRPRAAGRLDGEILSVDDNRLRARFAGRFELLCARCLEPVNEDLSGDFDLIFGAAHFNMKIVDLPVRYGERVYGDTNIQRWSHGWLLLKMVWFAYRKLKAV